MRQTTLQGSGAAEFSRQARRQFRAFVQRNEYPCLGAKAALSSNSCDLHCYPRLGGSVAALAKDLSRFVASPRRQRSKFASFVAIFRAPLQISELEFERRLWATLQKLNHFDATKHAWDFSVASEPSRADFAFSFAGLALYVVGMHRHSSRRSRRFSFPSLVFNAHEQFRRLRAEGKWERIKSIIRERDRRLQGTINPMLADFGERSEARQYSGRKVPATWTPSFKAARCPFAH